jgi:hypothetical protein
LLQRQVTAGDIDLIWDGRDEDGRAVASGVYFAKLDARSGRQMQRLVLMR